ncbi:hypothetical protein EDB89DRAFT_1912298 [Lactarius sanguifluus]|nr:hypothetical protein EDB89DRAFT_1912298 [Lactarius sanguifluus]
MPNASSARPAAGTLNHGRRPAGGVTPDHHHDGEYYSSESQGAWRGGSGGAGLVTWHAGLCVVAVLWRVGGLVRGRPVWRWSGMVWVEVMGGMGLAGITMGWQSRGFACGVVVTLRQRGGGVAWLTVGAGP